MKEKQPFEIPHEGDESVRAARRKIDDDINKHELEIRFLKRGRNKLSSISVLPPEVLSKIFIFLRDSFPAIPYHNDQVQWIRVGHVCHHWREVALSCPSLWSVPAFAKPDLAQEMIHRSKMAVLTITATAGGTPRMLEQLENAIAQISRIQSIHLTLRAHPDKMKGIISSFSQPAPLLERINLIDPSTLSYSTRLSFPSDALTDAPHLRNIVFERLNFSWESAVFKHGGVTVLRLKNELVFHGASTIDHMMDALGHLPNLRILELDNAVPSHTTCSGKGKTLEFKFLERLVLGTEAAGCIFLLRHIQYPSRATVRLRCSCAEIEDCTTIFSLVGQNLHSTQNVEAGIPHSPAIIRSARMISLGAGAAEIIFFDKVRRVEHWYLFDDSDPIIQIYFGGRNIVSQKNDRLIANVNNYFDLSSLEALFMNWNFTPDQIHVIRDSFGKLPKLRFIRVSESLPEICLAINESSNEVLAEEPEETTFPPVTVFPALRSIMIKDVDFRQHRYPENTQSLVDMLMKRSNMNAPIDGLILEGCRGVLTAQQRILGELVVDLKVDRETIDVRELDSDDDWGAEDYSDEDEDDEDDEDDYSDDYYGDPYYDVDEMIGWFPF